MQDSVFGKGDLEDWYKGISNAATMDQHAGLDVSPIKCNNKVVGVELSGSLKGATFRGHGWE